jgi:hypothetical protein
MTKKIHELKTWCEPFEAVWSGLKTYEIRKNDRGFQHGDTLCLREWDRHTEQYTGRVVTAEVGFATEGTWGLPPDLCVMSLLTVVRERSKP